MVARDRIELPSAPRIPGWQTRDRVLPRSPSIGARLCGKFRVELRLDVWHRYCYRGHGAASVDRDMMRATSHLGESSRTERSGCAARTALKATLEKGATERWIIGSNDVATIMASCDLAAQPVGYL